MKFKKPETYAAPVVAAPVIERPMGDGCSDVPPKKEPMANVWVCMACENKADILHKGTTYCKACYAARNREGTLVN